MPAVASRNPILGAHMSIAGGVDKAIERGAQVRRAAHCTLFSIQIFLKNNMQWRGRRLAAAEIARFRAARPTTGIDPVFAHSSYLVNLAATNKVFRRRSVAAMIDEVRRATALGVPFIVMHPGAHLGAGEPAGLRQVAAALDTIFAATPDSPVRIALETTAGQGTNLGYRFEHLAEIYQLVDRPRRLAVCVDTCHLFAAGYDLRTPRQYQRVMRTLDRVIGTRQVVAWHLNDAKTPLGSRVDRHQHIGEGYLGLTAFRCVVRDRRWRGIPMVLETPKSPDLHEDVRNLRVLRRLMG
ncbi:deoxyribonuclease IV [bacterium]|nr:deoxyribonuclease IV [bacterium]